MKAKGTEPDIDVYENIEECKEKDDLKPCILQDCFIGNIDQIVHEYHADNEYILKGYRVHYITVPRILRSLFRLHNETFNIWSHLIGCLISFLCLIITFATLTSYRLIYEQDIAKVIEGKEEYSDKDISQIKESFHLLSQYNYDYLNNNSEYNRSSLEDQRASYIKHELYKELFDDYSNVYSVIQYFSELQIICIDCIEETLQSLNDSMSLPCSVGDFCKRNDTNFTSLILDRINTTNFIIQSTLPFEGEIKVLEKWPFAPFFIGAMMCLGFSATFHLFSCHEKIVKQVLNRLDYAGIVFLIVGSCFPPYFYYFYCNFNYAIGYLVFMNIFGLIVLLVMMLTYFDHPKYTSIKGLLFLTFGISAGIGMMHIQLFP